MKRELLEESIVLGKFIAEQNAGASLSYSAIEHQTRIRMDARGKQLLRAALRRRNIEYTSRRNYGIVLADAEWVAPILSTKIMRIDRAVKRGDRTQRNLQEQFFESLGLDEQKQVLFAGAVFGAIRIATEQGRLLYKKNLDRAALSQVRIELPKLG